MGWRNYRMPEKQEAKYWPTWGLAQLVNTSETMTVPIVPRAQLRNEKVSTLYVWQTASSRIPWLNKPPWFKLEITANVTRYKKGAGKKYFSEYLLNFLQLLQLERVLWSDNNGFQNNRKQTFTKWLHRLIFTLLKYVPLQQYQSFSKFQLYL